MKRKKIINIIMVIVVLIVIIVLVKNNVVATKEQKINVSDTTGATLTLDTKSELVTSLYNSLNLDLINNTCTDCIINDNYNFVYFMDYETSVKELSDSAKLYIAFNSLYSSNKINENTEEENKYVIDIDTVNEEIKRLFNETIESYDNNISISKTCGMTDYLYTGLTYEFTVTSCDIKKELANTKLVSSYKENNYIYLNIEAFKIETDYDEYENSDEIFNIVNFDSDEVLLTESLDNILKLSDDVFENYEINTYKFCFELDGDSYYLKNISKV